MNRMFRNWILQDQRHSYWFIGLEPPQVVSEECFVITIGCLNSRQGQEGFK
jgi:hypothetical protein